LGVGGLDTIPAHVIADGENDSISPLPPAAYLRPPLPRLLPRHQHVGPAASPCSLSTQARHFSTKNRESNRTEMLVFSVFGFGFGSCFLELWLSASVLVLDDEKPNRLPASVHHSQSNPHRPNTPPRPYQPTPSPLGHSPTSAAVPQRNPIHWSRSPQRGRGGGTSARRGRGLVSSCCGGGVTGRPRGGCATAVEQGTAVLLEKGGGSSRVRAAAGAT
jgi:hypothetical protein